MLLTFVIPAAMFVFSTFKCKDTKAISFVVLELSFIFWAILPNQITVALHAISTPLAKVNLLSWPNPWPIAIFLIVSPLSLKSRAIHKSILSITAVHSFFEVSCINCFYCRVALGWNNELTLTVLNAFFKLTLIGSPRSECIFPLAMHLIFIPLACVKITWCKFERTISLSLVLEPITFIITLVYPGRLAFTMSHSVFLLTFVNCSRFECMFYHVFFAAWKEPTLYFGQLFIYFLL